MATSYGEHFAIEDGGFILGSDLDGLVRSTGLSAANLSACVSGDATRSELRHCVTTLLDASVRTAGAHDVDVLIDCVLE